MRKILRGHVFKIFLFTLCVAFSYSYEAQAQASGTYTINSLAPTGGTNFNSFADAVNFLKSGGLSGSVIMNVQSGSGPYNEQVHLDNTIGTTAAKTLTFNCNGVTLTFLSTNTSDRAGVKLDNIGYVTFDNLVITPQAASAGQYGYGFHLLNNSDNNVIKNCKITNQSNTTPANNEGIVINGDHGNSTTPGYSNCDNNVIRQNTISGGMSGITLSNTPLAGNPAQFIQGNQILKNVITDASRTGIQLNYNDGTLVDGNEITGGTHTTALVYGIFLNLYNQNVKITGNRIHSFSSTLGSSQIFGINNVSQGAAGKENLIANNLIYDFISTTTQYGIASRTGGPGTFFNVYHNTISLDDQTTVGTTTNGMYFQSITDVNVLNNIITVTRQSSSANYCINLNATPTRLFSDKNVLNVSGSIGPNAVGWRGAPIFTLSDWQKAIGLDLHSVFTNPLYTNLAGFDFKPTEKSIDNMALYVNINTDITDAARSTVNPDPGCYEFVSPACTTPVTAGTMQVSPDSILCSGPPVSLSISGNSWGSGQTYTFQTAATINGTYNNISSGLIYPSFNITPAQTFFYRVAVTCGANTAYSSPVRILVNHVLSGGTYTINSAQPTAGINFNSFTDAALSMQCGLTGSVVLNVAPGSGPYNEQVIFSSINSSATRTVTINGNGATISFAPTNFNERAVIKLKGVGYFTIDSLNINVQGKASFGYGVHMTNNADHNTIKRCKITLDTAANINGYAGIVINPSPFDPIERTLPSFCDSNVITNNRITGGYYGITCTSTYNSPGTSMSLYNIITNNTLSDNYRFGMYLAGNGNMLIDSNDISQPTRTTFGNYSGIYVDQANYGLKISKNRIHNLCAPGKAAAAEYHGIHFEYSAGTLAAPNIVSNNLLHDLNGLPYQFGLYTISSNYLKFYNNTVSLEDSSAASGFTYGLAVIGNPTTGFEFKNNSIVIKRSGAGSRYCIYLTNNDNNLVSDYNNFYLATPVGKTVGPSFIGSMALTDYTTLANWLAAKKDSGSISMDPVYTDPVNGNFSPTKILFDDKGAPVGITTDFNNITRSSTRPDIGAYEFTICKPLTTPVLSIDSVGINTVQFAWTAVVNTSGYQVSRDGVNWSAPSSGISGLTHTITGLKRSDTTGIMVRALGTLEECPVTYSQRLLATAINDRFFIPNTFTPNGNGKSDVFKVYSTTLKSLHLMVFNQWGEKLFETTDPNGEWDGRNKGKPAPIGVYVYVATMVIADGTKITQKGTFNLIR